MKSFHSNVSDVIRYALSDWRVTLVIGGFMFLSSIGNKYSYEITPFDLSNMFMIFVVGYGSYITYYTINGEDRLPRISNVKRISWEGIKKSVIVWIYSMFLIFFFNHAKTGYESGTILVFIISGLMFCVVWMLMVGGFINRYFYRGKISKAFNLIEIAALLKNNLGYDFMRLIIAVIISQLFLISVFIDHQPSLGVFEIIQSVLIFFLAPYLYIAIKRFVGLSIRKMVI